MSTPRHARANSLTPATSRTPIGRHCRPAAAAHGELLARVGELALELLALLDQGRERAPARLRPAL